MPSKRSEEGRAAEEAARAHLESKGFALLQANYRTKLGEVDLVMKDDDAVVFVEVRRRKSAAYGRPEETVRSRKQGRVIKAAIEFIKENNLAGVPLRCDVVSVTPDGLTHFKNAFVPRAGKYFI
jgi:putative endonuclease